MVAIKRKIVDAEVGAHAGRRLSPGRDTVHLQRAGARLDRAGYRHQVRPADTGAAAGHAAKVRRSKGVGSMSHVAQIIQNTAGARAGGPGRMGCVATLRTGLVRPCLGPVSGRLEGAETR